MHHIIQQAALQRRQETLSGGEHGDDTYSPTQPQDDTSSQPRPSAVASQMVDDAIEREWVNV